MAERGVKANHRLGPILVTLASDRAIAQFTGTIDIPSVLKGIDVIMSSDARFPVRAERRAGVWRLSGFDIVYLRDEIAAVIPEQAPAIDPKAVNAFRASYRFMSYSLTLSGFPCLTICRASIAPIWWMPWCAKFMDGPACRSPAKNRFFRPARGLMPTGPEREFLDSPKAEWLWESAETRRWRRYSTSR